MCAVLVGAADVGLAMVSQGMAWWYRAYQREQTPAARAAYAAAEQNAQAAGQGLWSDGRAAAPWEWRRARKEKGPPGASALPPAD